MGSLEGRLAGDTDASDDSTVSTGGEVVGEVVTGLSVGDWVGIFDGTILESSERLDDGDSVISFVGLCVGLWVGDWMGSFDGIILGSSDRLDDGYSDNSFVGLCVGT